MNTLTYTLVIYRPDGPTNKSEHDIFVSRDWQEVVHRTASLLDKNARHEAGQPWSYCLLVDGQIAGPYTRERLVRAATNCRRPVQE